MAENKDYKREAITMDQMMSTGYLLSRAGRIIHEKFERAIEPMGLRARHFGLLICLRNYGPLSQSEAAKKMSIDKSTIVAIVDDLEKWDLVERKRNIKDRRLYDLTLTKDGIEKLHNVIHGVEGLAKEWMKPLSQKEIEKLYELLSRLLFGTDGLLAEFKS
ncbi:MarR family transcriptional regulator [Pullulanibacillus sp. KACC 23026]|uniref:MarR family winged helix-turn-helix transcriptional regulator n=1 Tax=Pullulanibacillus sp. KACC 23026 TaxID=3028315 RepID=UPI0023AF29A9|nr:MarR family transcriptional regulator [Pullulanibacillus sp. KACC 23026]WEG12356.1 MarR family transcriptional regulator [Pullulanibacillus sp. KACC 23026]